MEKIAIYMQKQKKEIKEICQRKWLYLLGYGYLLSSVIIFLLGNVKWIISIPFTILLFIAFKKAMQNCPDVNTEIFREKKVLIGIVLIFIVWIIFSGIGGFTWQNIWDHKFRNAVFQDLVQRPWPVIEGDNALCYYLGFWLPSALIGKVFGLQIGYFFQMIWTLLGVILTFLMICQYLKKMKISNALIFIFFSGLDVITFYLFSDLSFNMATAYIMNGRHLESVLLTFNSSANTTLLFWVYNQIVPFWVGMMLLLLQKNNKSIGFIFASLFLFAPFPLVALAPVCFYKIFANYDMQEKETTKPVPRKKKELLQKLKMACTFENFLSIFLLFIIGLFFMSNIATSRIGILPINSATLLKYAIYMICEFIIYLLFVYPSNRKDMVLKILILVTVLAPFITLGNSYDFAYRTCIPLAFYIMLLVMKELENKKAKEWEKTLLIIVICIGAITPVTEMIRAWNMNKMAVAGYIQTRSDELPTAFQKENNECYENFMATTDSIFYRYLAREPKK